MRIPGGKKHWNTSDRTKKVSVSGRTTSRNSGSQLPGAGESGPEHSLIPAHLRARKAYGLAGVSNKWLYCVCPAGVQARAGVMGTAPLPLRREGSSGLRGLVWRLCSLLREIWPLPESPSLAFSIIFPRRAEPKLELTVQAMQGGCPMWILDKCYRRLPPFWFHPYWSSIQPQALLHWLGFNL